MNNNVTLSGLKLCSRNKVNIKMRKIDIAKYKANVGNVAQKDDSAHRLPYSFRFAVCIQPRYSFVLLLVLRI